VSGPTEEELRRAYGSSIEAVELADTLASQLADIRRLAIENAAELVRVRGLLETVLGIQLGEVTIATGLTVQTLTPETLAAALAPCPSCGWIASHDDDCPRSSST
jgi:hypothetical protein